MQILTPAGYKAAADCSVGDEVLAYDVISGAAVTNTITAIERIDLSLTAEQWVAGMVPDPWVLVNGRYRLYPNQSIWADGNVTHASLLQLGQTIYDDADQPVLIIGLDFNAEPLTEWYRLEIDGDHSYIADYLTLHNASRFWVGGTGTWDNASTTHWSASTGGGTGASVPTSSDNVNFDTNSGATAYTVTLSYVNAPCNDMTWAAAGDGTKPTFAGSTALNVSGSLTLVSGMGWTYTGTLTLNATTTGKTVTTAGVTVNNNWSFSGSGGGWTLQDALNTSSGTLTIGNGTFTSNNQTITCRCWFADTGSHTINLGSSTINVTGSATTTLAMIGTLNAGTSTINITTGSAGSSIALNMGALAYNTVNITGAGIYTLGGSPSANFFSYTSTTNRSDQLKFSGGMTVAAVLTLAGNSSLNRAFVTSDTLGTQRTLTGGILVGSNVDFQDVSVDASNKSTRSEEFDNSAWVKLTGDTITANTTTAPDGTLTADKLVEAAANVEHQMWRGSTITAGATFTASIFAKAAERSVVRIQCEGDISSGPFAVFDLSTGTVASTGVTGGNPGTAFISARIVPFPNGFYRLIVTGKIGTTDTTAYIHPKLMQSTGGATTYLGDGTSGMYFWGGQLREGSEPGVYCRTTSAAVSSLDLSAITGLSGDALGNAGINFTPSAAQTWTGTGNWSDPTKWTSRPPLPQDDVTVGAGATGTVTCDMLRMGRSIDTTGCIRQLQFAGAVTFTVFGSLTFGSGMSFAGGGLSFTFSGRSAYSLTFNGKFPSAQYNISAPGGTYTLQDTFNLSASSWSINSGTFTVNNVDMTIATIVIGGTATLNMGSGTFTLNNTSGAIWNAVSTVTINAGTSTIKYAGTTTTQVNFRGAGKTYNNFWWSSAASTGILALSNDTTSFADTFKNFKVDCTTPRTVQLPSGATQTLNGYPGFEQVNAGINAVRNPTMSGAVAGNPGTDPTNWSRDQVQSGCTLQVTGTGSEFGMNYIEYQLDGTASLQQYCLINPDNAFFAAGVGQYWFTGIWGRVVSGSVSVTGSTPNLRVQTDALNSSNVNQGSSFGTQLSLAATGSRPTQLPCTVQNTPTNTAKLRMWIEVGGGGVGTVYTALRVRIYLPQVSPQLLINSSTAASAATISCAHELDLDYLALQDSTATGGSTYRAGTHSTSVSNNTGWTFGNVTISAAMSLAAAGTVSQGGKVSWRPVMAAAGAAALSTAGAMRLKPGATIAGAASLQAQARSHAAVSFALGVGAYVAQAARLSTVASVGLAAKASMAALATATMTPGADMSAAAVLSTAASVAFYQSIGLEAGAVIAIDWVRFEVPSAKANISGQARFGFTIGAQPRDTEV
jgi:hypothetical protein